MLSSSIIMLAVVAASLGIFSSGGPGRYNIETVRGETVTVYGIGLYKHMSQDVAPQGIAQDYITLLVAVPLLLDGSVIPGQVEHYTTLIVQGLDLGLLLPLSFVSGVLFIKRTPFGYLFTPVYFIFLSILMAALTAKVVAMGMLGQSVMPAIMIIPFFGIAAIICSVLIFKNIREPAHEYS